MNTRRFKQLKLELYLAWPKSPTKARADPDLSCLLKDPVAYMTRYKESYLYIMARTNKCLKDPAVWTPNALRRHPIFCAKEGEMSSLHSPPPSGNQVPRARAHGYCLRNVAARRRQGLAHYNSLRVASLHPDFHNFCGNVLHILRRNCLIP